MRFTSRTSESSRTSAVTGSMPAIGLGVLLTALAGCSSNGEPPPAGREAAGASAASATGERAQNVRLVGYTDLQGRQALEIKTKSDSANGNWVYIGHVPNTRTKEATINPISGQKEWNGTSIVDITDPAKPRLVWHIPNTESANSRSVSVVYDYKFDGSGHDYLVRNSESPNELKFQVFDITTRDSDPSKITLVSEISGTPVNSCGPGCGGKFKDSPPPAPGATHPVPRAHKGHWSPETGLYYTSCNEPGFRATILHIWDLKDPKNPKFVGRAWLPGQKEGEPGFESQYAHHPIVDEKNHRLYAGFRDGSGHIGAWDISDPATPKLVFSYDTSPPYRGPHTVSPIVYDKVENFEGEGLPRTYALVTDELGEECGHPVKSHRTCSTSRSRAARCRCRRSRCRWATSARVAATSARTSTPSTATPSSIASKTSSPLSPTSTPASASSTSPIHIA